MADEFQIIERAQLNEKIDRDDDFVLVDTLQQSASNNRHLHGAVTLDDTALTPELLPDKDAEIVTYCTNFN